ncbi:hypothetical protein D3C71_2062530 [compost metagenome]
MLLQITEESFAGVIAAADVLEAGVFGGEGLVELLLILRVVIPGRTMEATGTHQHGAVSGDALEQAVPAA